MVDRRIEPSFERRNTPFEAVATFALVAALLYFGAGIIVPLVLAVLLAFALTPLVTWLNRRLKLPDAVAVILTVIAVLCVLVSLMTLAGLQVARLADELPSYQQTVTTKLEGLQEQFGGPLLERINGTISDLTAQFSDATESDPPPEGRPVPVSITNDVGPLGLLTSVLGSILGPVATVAIVAIFLIFLLLGRSDMLERFIRLVGSGDYAKANLAMADASKRVGRYLLVQLAINSTYGLLFGVGLWLIGVPSAFLWGVLIVAFRYIPFIGALIIAIVPFALAFAVDPGWNMLLLSLGLFLVLDLTTANVVEPRLYGSSTGVSPLAILISAMFWATLWGPIGLILATPMTVCLVVIGRHIPSLRFLDTLLGSDPVLTPPEQLYQRLLKGDALMAIEIMESYTVDHSRAAFMSEVAFPALVMASAELADRPAFLEQRRQLTQTFDVLLEEFNGERAESQSLILLVGGRTEMDEAAAKLLALQLAERGVPARVLPPFAIRPEAIDRLELDDVDTLAMVFLGSDIRSQARYVSRRIRRRNPGVRLAACAFGAPMDGESTERLHLDDIYREMGSALQELEEGWKAQAGSAEVASQTRYSIDPGNPRLRAFLEATAAEFKVPVATVSLAGQERPEAEQGLVELMELALGGDKALVVSPVENTAAYDDNAFLQSNGIHLYAAAPLRMPDDTGLGALVLLDYKVHPLEEAELERLKQRAGELTQLILDVQIKAPSTNLSLDKLVEIAV